MQTIGELADTQAALQAMPGRTFTFNVDGVFAPRDAPAFVIDYATDVTLVAIDYHPETLEQ